VDESIVVPLPHTIGLDKGALVEPVAVAVHDVRRARVEPGESVLVVGGGPIGLLIALVATARGASVLISEPNRFRRETAERLGFTTIDPAARDGLEAVESWTDGAGVDIAFEVSGAVPGLHTATHALRVRGRLVVVAIHSEPVPFDLFRVFWRELEVFGARVYQREDFEEAVRLIAADAVPAGQLISTIEPLKRTADAFAALQSGAEVVKVLIEVGGEYGGSGATG
jgi:(R,R)-butanediol dehydrogenase / meso-butanediol dehydrogenase / diacetyl reductase